MIKDIKSIRKNIDKEFSVIFEQAERAAAKVGTQPSMPCIVKKQVNRDNAEGDSPDTYYRRLFLIPTVIMKEPLGKDSYQQIIEMYG